MELEMDEKINVTHNGRNRRGRNNKILYRSVNNNRQIREEKVTLIITGDWNARIGKD